MISVIIPIYGVEKYIVRCAKSLFNQTLKNNIEFIFVNDATKDRSVELLIDTLNEFPERKDQVHILNHKTNLGLAQARLTGINYAHGDYIAHCDSDDWVEADMYQMLYDAAISKNYDLAICNFFIEDPDKTIIFKRNYNNSINNLIKDCLAGYWSTVWRFIVKKTIINEASFIFDTSICHGEDYLYTNQCVLKSKNFVSISKPLYHYNRTNLQSMMKNVATDNIKQQIRATDIIYNSLNKNIKTEYGDALIERKYFVKKLFLLIKNKNGFKIYPEVNKKVLTMSNIKMKNKVKFYLLKFFSFLLNN